MSVKFEQKETIRTGVAAPGHGAGNALTKGGTAQGYLAVSLQHSYHAIALPS